MNKKEDDFTYYREIIMDPELDSSPLADFEKEGFEEAEYCHILPEKIYTLAEEFCSRDGMVETDLAETAFLILLEKYSNSSAALSAVSVEGRLIPVFVSSERHPDFAGYRDAFLSQLEAGRQHTGTRFEELCAGFGLRSLPFLTSEDRFYRSFSLSDYKELDTKICVYFDGEDHGLTVRAK
mgnify:CR=1 FL=1